jgi:hypothetical protein
VDREIMINEIDACLKSQTAEPNFVRDYCISGFTTSTGSQPSAISRLPNIRLTVKGVESTLLRFNQAGSIQDDRAVNRAADWNESPRFLSALCAATYRRTMAPFDV